MGQTDEVRPKGTLATVFAVMRDENLSPELKTLWAIYRSYENPDRGRAAYPGDELLAEHLGRDPRTVRRHRAELIRRGYLQQVLRGPYPAHYRTRIPDTDKGGQNCPGFDKGGQKGGQKGGHQCPPSTGRGGEYGEYGEYISDASAAPIASRESFFLAVDQSDPRRLHKLAGVHLEGFDPKLAAEVCEIPDLLLGWLEDRGRADLADVVGAAGDEAAVIADAVRDMCRKAGRWDGGVFWRFVMAAAEVRSGEGAA